MKKDMKKEQDMPLKKPLRKPIKANDVNPKWILAYSETTNGCGKGCGF